MVSDIIDERLLGALHLRALTRAGFDHEPEREHAAFQIGSLDALMAGGYDGDTTIAELLSHGDTGIGTIAGLDGELVVADGVAVAVASGVLVGFRFPDAAAGLEVPGFHLHFLADDRSCGGHVLDLTVAEGNARVDGGDELHVELAPQVGLGRPGAADRAAIARVEGARPAD